MNVIVCVKQIPDPALPSSLDPSTKTLKRDGKLILDESDSYGVEMALQLVGKAGGGEVSLVSMAPNGETSGMRTALAMGAAKGVLVSDPALQGTDALTTAKVLAAAVQKLGGADLIIAATESTDGYTGTVPEQMAELLGLPSITFAKTVDIDGANLKVNRQTEAATTRSAASCRRSSASPPAWSSRATRASRASWPPSRSRSTPSPPPTSACSPWVGPAPARRSSRSVRPPSARRARSSKTTARASPRSCRSSRARR